jgi:hypothetical protein
METIPAGIPGAAISTSDGTLPIKTNTARPVFAGVGFEELIKICCFWEESKSALEEDCWTFIPRSIEGVKEGPESSETRFW